jgi:hypothetical protein
LISILGRWNAARFRQVKRERGALASVARLDGDIAGRAVFGATIQNDVLEYADTAVTA